MQNFNWHYIFNWHYNATSYPSDVVVREGLVELSIEVRDVRLIAVVEVARWPHGELPHGDSNALLKGNLRALGGLQGR